MKHGSSVSRRVLALTLVLGVALTLAPRPASAAEASPVPAPAAPLAASIASAARTVTLAPPVARATEQAKPGDELAGSTAFFARPIGIAIIGVLVAGTGYAIYSASHDRIHSPNR